MKKFNFKVIDGYRNNGQKIEQSIRYALTGEIVKADNIPATVASDCNGYQIKSARATVAKYGYAGIKAPANTANKRAQIIAGWLTYDSARAYIYGTADGVAYVMDADEYLTFTANFSTITTDSAKNGGRYKVRLRYETAEMREWLENQINAGA